MTLQANTKNIEWLIHRMYVARREMQANNVNDPVFVLLTKDADDRQAVEEIILRHLLARYGDLVAKGTFGIDSSSSQASIFTLAEIGVRIMLLDVDWT